MDFAERILQTDPPPLTSLMKRAARLRAEGRRVFQLGQAAVDYHPPATFLRSIVEVCQSKDLSLHGYAPDPGLPELRNALSDYIARSFRFEVDPERELIVTPGANHAAYTALSVLLGPEDEAILISPYYFNHLMTVTLMGARAKTVSASPNHGYTPRIDSILDAWTPRTRVLVLVNPSNPSGARYPDDWVRELGKAIVRDPHWSDVWLLSDQTYQEIFFDGGYPLSPGEFDDIRPRTVTLSSFSKSYALAGWRLGFMTAPSNFIDEALKIQDSSVICAAKAAQWALARTLGQEEDSRRYSDEKRALLARRRDALLDPLIKDRRLNVHMPGGACFAFVGLPGDIDADPFSWDLMERHGVVTVPGYHFGPEWKQFLRLSFGTGSENELNEASQRIVDFLTETT
jgi:aspartate aminotransferase